MTAPRRSAFLLLLFTALTLVVTYPQVASISNGVPYHTDPYFSMWRLAWVASRLIHEPLGMFDANIFFPERDVLAFSDAMLLPGTILAPLSWAGVGIVTIYNLALLSAIALSGFAAALLAFELTGCVSASVVAGAIFAFAPYRFDHYVHLELQLTFWMPLALIYLHRLIERPRARDAVVLATLAVAQALSSVYMALFFALYCVPVAALLVLSRGASRSWALARNLLGAAVLTIFVLAPYGLPYVRAAQHVGTRSMDDVRPYGATLANYRAAPPSNRFYGSTLAPNGRHELFLFPGIVAVVLGAIGILAPGGRARFAYLAGGILAFDITRGAGGILFPWLFEHVTVFRALRVPARMAMLVNLSLSVLSALGASWLLARLKAPGWRFATATGLVALAVVEFASDPVPAAVPPPARVDRWLARQPPAVIVQLPLPSRRNGPRSWDWLFMYQGIAHWQRMLNGLSGYVPASYVAMLSDMEEFPDDRSIEMLRQRGVDYVVLRGERFKEEEWSRVTHAVEARRDLTLVARLPESGHFQEVYRLSR
jgi:hypothetical protein